MKGTLACVLLLTWLSTSGQVLKINDHYKGAQKFEDLLLVLTDSSGKLTFQDVRSMQFEPNEAIQGNILNFGMSQKTYWCKLEVENQLENQYIKFHEPLIDEIDVYFAKDSQLIRKSKTGASTNFHNREIAVSNFHFKLPKGNYTCYIKFKSNFNLQVPVSTGLLKDLVEKQHSVDFLLALYFGLMLIMIIYNFFVYLSTRDRSYLFYILYIFFVTLFYASLKGISFEYLWPNTPYFNFLIPSFASIINVFGALFIIILLQTRKFLPRLTKGIYAFIAVFIACILINILGVL